MKKKILSLFFVMVFSLIFLSCAPTDDFVVIHQVTGPIETNCYLLYDVKSKEAALFDVGGPIDSLITHINNKNLKLKYLFATHCHMNHIEGIPMIREKFPNTLLCFNKEDYEDFLVSIEWIEKNRDPNELAEMKRNPAIGKWFEYDLSIFCKPDIYLEDNQIFKLGNLKISTILSPGHSIGSICYHAGDVLFSGDVLFYRQVGRTDLLGGSDGAIVKSVRRLYTSLPVETKVYPGHGRFTDIGFNLIGETGLIYAVFIAVCVLILQIVLSNIWLKYYRFGPLEWLWRSLTYKKRIKIKYEIVNN